jgi:Cu(I)/Ag(I) efflux system membrane fusion protein
VVFVESATRAYAAREIQLGRIGDTMAEVVSGLTQGDKVVTQGALLLDGQAQLAHAAIGGEHEHAASVPSKVAATEPAHDAAAYALLKTLALTAADAASVLAADDLPAYQKNQPALRAALQAYLAGYEPAARGPLAAFKNSLADSADLHAARHAFEPLSTALADLVREQHLDRREGLHVYECPMTPVLGTGRWLARENKPRNPFFGSAMLDCGEEVK